MISIIIPTLNEERYLKKTLQNILSLPGLFEIIVVDGGSKDKTLKIATSFKEVKSYQSDKGRAHQMNYGADRAKGEVFLFLHADTLLPEDTYRLIQSHLKKDKYIGGSFKLNFDKDHPFLKFYSWCSQFSYEFFTYGDHGIFMKTSIYHEIAGYAGIPFMEDVEIQKRLRKKGNFKKLKASVTTSARRFEKTGIITQLIMDVVLIGFYKLGVSPRNLKKFYKNHLEI